MVCETATNRRQKRHSADIAVTKLRNGQQSTVEGLRSRANAETLRTLRSAETKPWDANRCLTALELFLKSLCDPDSFNLEAARSVTYGAFSHTIVHPLKQDPEHEAVTE